MTALPEEAPGIPLGLRTVVSSERSCSPLERGVLHAEQLFDPLEVFADTEELGISFDPARS